MTPMINFVTQCQCYPSHQDSPNSFFQRSTKPLCQYVSTKPYNHRHQGPSHRSLDERELDESNTQSIILLTLNPTFLTDRNVTVLESKFLTSGVRRSVVGTNHRSCPFGDRILTYRPAFPLPTAPTNGSSRMFMPTPRRVTASVTSLVFYVTSNGCNVGLLRKKL